MSRGTSTWVRSLRDATVRAETRDVSNAWWPASGTWNAAFQRDHSRFSSLRLSSAKRTPSIRGTGSNTRKRIDRSFTKGLTKLERSSCGPLATTPSALRIDHETRTGTRVDSPFCPLFSKGRRKKDFSIVPGKEKKICGRSVGRW